MKNKKSSAYDIYKSVRRTWGEMSPVTRKLESRKLYSRKQKHRQSVAEVGWSLINFSGLNKIKSWFFLKTTY